MNRWLLCCMGALSFASLFPWVAIASEADVSVGERISVAIASGAHKVTIPPGVYRLTAPAGRPHLRFRDLHDFEIDATGATFVFTSRDQTPVEFEGCRAVTLRGATLVHASLPYSQGIKASNGVVENNLVEGSTMAGIVISPEIGHWNEADFSRDLVIRHNTLRRIGTALQPWNPMAGALTIAAYEAGAFVPRPGGHEDVRVIANTFEENDGPNILVTSARGVVIEENRFVRPMRSPATRGMDRDVKRDALIQIRECTGVELRGNELVAPGPFMRAAVKVDTASTEVHGAGSAFSIP